MRCLRNGVAGRCNGNPLIKKIDSGLCQHVGLDGYPARNNTLIVLILDKTLSK